MIGIVFGTFWGKRICVELAHVFIIIALFEPQFKRGYLCVILLSVERVVDLLAVIGPDRGLLHVVDIELQLATDEVLDMGCVSLGVSGEVFAGFNLLLLPGSQRPLDSDEAALPETPHEVLAPAAPGLSPCSQDEVVSLFEVLQPLLLITHGGVDDHVKEHHVLLGSLVDDAQGDVIIVTIFYQSVP